MGNGKNLAICPVPFAISDQAGVFQRPAKEGVEGLVHVLANELRGRNIP
jgi:hypothetical protein